MANKFLKNPSFVDLFCGAGGLSLGLIQAGWKPLLSIDNWEDAINTYSMNLNKHKALRTDLINLSQKDIINLLPDFPTWIVGGPPCQGFSTVGKRQRLDPRNQLILHFARAVSILKPQFFLIENVLGLRDMEFTTEICTLFKDIGYKTTPLVLKAADYGVPQLRRRVFFVGSRDGLTFLPPMPTKREHEYVTVWDAISDLPELGAGEQALEYQKPPQNSYQKTLRYGSNLIQGHIASRHPSNLIKAISFIPDGGNRKSIPSEYQPKSGFHNSYSRLNSKAPAVAVTQNMGKPSGTRCIHPFQNRGLTAREGARLQGFPDTFHFLGGITSQRLQIANAVPPILAKELAIAMERDSSWREAEDHPCPIHHPIYEGGLKQTSLPL